MDTAAQDAAIEAERRRIEGKQDAQLATAAEARRRLQEDVRESQRSIMARHAQDRWGSAGSIRRGSSCWHACSMRGDGPQEDVLCYRASAHAADAHVYWQDDKRKSPRTHGQTCPAEVWAQLCWHAWPDKKGTRCRLVRAVVAVTASTHAGKP